MKVAQKENGEGSIYMRRSSLVAMPIVALAASCNPVQNLDGADAQIEKFQTYYDRGKGDEMYRMLGPQIKKMSSRKQFDDTLYTVSTRLGPIKSSERTHFNVSVKNAQTVTTIVMQTNFQKGNGTETYTFLGTGEDMKLEGWFVDSPQLMITPEELQRLNAATGNDTDKQAGSTPTK